MNEKFLKIYRTNPTVKKAIDAGGNMADVVVALVEQNELLQREIVRLNTIVPKKIKMPDGQIMRFTCPDDLIPIDVYTKGEYVSEQCKDPGWRGMNFQSKQIEDHSQASKMVAVEDELLVEKCLEIMRTEKRAATSVFQRRLQLGYSRAARLLEILEERGFVGPFTGSSSREILRYE